VSLISALLVLTLAIAVGLVTRLWSQRLGARAWLVLDALGPLLVATALLIAVFTWTYFAGAAPRASHHTVVSSSAALLALPGALALGRARALWAGLWCVVVVFFLWADLVYFRFFGNLIPLMAVGSATHLWDVRDSIASLLQPWDVAWAALGGTGLAVALLWRPVRGEHAPPRRRRLWVALAVVVALLLGAIPFTRNLNRWAIKNKQNFYDRERTVAYVGVVGAHARDLVRVWRERERWGSLTQETVDTTRAALQERRAAWPGPSQLDGALADTNLLFVQLEGVMQWLLDARVSSHEVTPFLNQLKERRALWFPNIYDQTGSARTSDCEYLVNNSLHPIEGGSVAIRRQDNNFVTIGTTLRDLGWDTLSAHGYHRGFWNRAVVHPRYGYQRSFFRREMEGAEMMGWGISDKAFLERVVGFAKDAKPPFYAYAITLTTHHPYDYIDEDQQSLNAGSLEGERMGHYLNSMRYLDEALAEMFAHLKKAGLAESTTVVLFGDHDSRLRLRSRELGKADRALNLDKTTMRSLALRAWETDLLPLLIVPPEGSPVGPQTIDTVGGLIDIGPTVLRLIGVEPPLSFVGRPLLPTREGGVAVRLDGSAADDQRRWTARGKGACRGPRRERLDLERCDELRATARRELDLSDTITMFDLAARMSGVATNE
jgi:phosphoglycerol transferase MdoB-like AlkP superfamily enzyme